MFLLNPKYYISLCEKLAKLNKNDDFRFWAYSRVDTVKRPEILSLVRKAGIKWLCLGIESGNKKIRLEISKGKFEDVDIREVIKMSHDNGVEIIGNYLFGLTGDTKESMQKTLDLSLELCTVAWNAYAVMALPGSSLYRKALNSGHKLPSSYEGYSFHAYDTLPLPTDTLSPGEILKFRDEAFHIYHTNTKFLDKVRDRYGEIAVNNILEQTKIKLKRKLYD